MTTATPVKVRKPENSVPGFPALERVLHSSGRLRTRVRGGLDVWQYVFVAQGYDFDVAKAAEHMGRDSQEVAAALEYYQSAPAEVDDHLAEIERMWQKVTIDPVTNRISLPDR